MVLLVLLFRKLPLDYFASSTVAREVVWHSQLFLRDLGCHRVYFLSVHGSINITVRPFSGIKCGFV